MKPKKDIVQIIHQDNNLVVINKPSGVSVTKDRTGQKQLLDLLNPVLGPEACDQLRLIHRLDKQTSGLLILAKNLETQSKISTLFEKRQVKKIYLTLVAGYPSKTTGSIKARLIRDKIRPDQMHVTRKKGKEAQTKWQLLANFTAASLIAVYPVTGRTHQIRVHLPIARLPLLIDPLYGSDKPFFLSSIKKRYTTGKYQTEAPLIEDMTLHAYQIQYCDPDTGEERLFLAPLPGKFKAAIKMLTKHNPQGQDAFLEQRFFEDIINDRPLKDLSI